MVYIHDSARKPGVANKLKSIDPRRERSYGSWQTGHSKLSVLLVENL
jgi:hypothetical protein